MDRQVASYRHAAFSLYGAASTCYVATIYCPVTLVNTTCRHVQQSAGDMSPCVGGAVLQLMASSVHLRGLGWSPPPPDNQLLLRSESRAVTGPTHVQPWALDTGMLILVTLFFHIATFYESAHKVLKHFVPVIN